MVTRTTFTFLVNSFLSFLSLTTAPGLTKYLPSVNTVSKPNWS